MLFVFLFCFSRVSAKKIGFFFGGGMSKTGNSRSASSLWRSHTSRSRRGNAVALWCVELHVSTSRISEDAAPQIRRRSAGVPPAFRTPFRPVPHPFRTRSARDPHRCRTGAAPVPHRSAVRPFRSGSARVPANSPEGEKKVGCFFRLFWCFCAFGGVFVFFGGCFCQKTPRRTSAGVPHAIRTVLRTCSALAPHLSALVPHLCRTCSALVPHLCRTCAALVPHLCRTCAALVPHLCRNVGGSAARRPLSHFGHQNSHFGHFGQPPSHFRTRVDVPKKVSLRVFLASRGLSQILISAESTPTGRRTGSHFGSHAKFSTAGGGVEFPTAKKKRPGAAWRRRAAAVVWMRGGEVVKVLCGTISPLLPPPPSRRPHREGLCGVSSAVRPSPRRRGTLRIQNAEIPR